MHNFVIPLLTQEHYLDVLQDLGFFPVDMATQTLSNTCIDHFLVTILNSIEVT